MVPLCLWDHSTQQNEHLCYTDAVRDLLTRSRGKFRNVMIVEQSNCGKTFMLKPLEHIYHAFCSSANSKYAWLGADQAEVIVLQDFRCSPELICRKDLMLLLEGRLLKLPSPKNHFVCDVYINKDIPIFATSKVKIHYVGKLNTRNEWETEMMDVRWKIFEFFHRIPYEEQKSVTPCPKFFSELILLGRSDRCHRY